MSNDKPVATAIIRFYSNRHIEVELDTLSGVNPRMLSIAGNLLNKKYRSMRNKHNANEHRRAEREQIAREKEEALREEEFHKKEDERLRLAAEKKDEDGGKEEEKDTDGNSEPKTKTTAELMQEILNAQKGPDETTE